MLYLRLFLLILAIFLTFCEATKALAADIYKPKATKDVEESFERLNANQPQAWYEADQAPYAALKITDEFPSTTWWTTFEDPYLSQYIEEALSGNPDVRIAFLKIAEQQTNVKKALGSFFPTANISGSVSYSENLVQSGGGAFGSSNTSTAGGGGFVSQNQAQRFIQMPLRVAYEPDVWGKYRQIWRAEKSREKATELDYIQAKLVLSSAVASTYFNLITADAYLGAQMEIVDQAEKDLAAETAKFQEGLVDRQTVENRQAVLSQEKLNMATGMQNRNILLHSLAILMGKTPEAAGDLKRSSLDDVAFPVVTEEGYPSGLLRRRPDILSAEAQFIASNYNTSAAKRALFPTINLVTQLGYSGIKIGNILNTNGLLWLLSGAFSQDLFAGFRNWSEFKRRQIVAEEVLENYRKTILTSFKEVNDSMVSIKADKVAFDEALTAQNSNAKQVELLNYRFNEGEISGQDTRQANIMLLKSKQLAALRKQALLIDRVSLYKALGGGY